MKEKDAHIDYEPQQLVMYVEKEDGSYGPIQTGSYISKNYLDDFWDKMIRLRKSLLEKLKNNEITPIHFYKIIHDFNDVELARRAGLPVYKVKQHQKINSFKKAKVADLLKYAYAFDIPVSNLFQALVIDGNNDDITDENLNPVLLRQTKTKNSLVVITKIELNKK